MAVSTPTKMSDFDGFIPPALSQPIFEKARRQSIVQQLAKQVPLGPSGVNVPVTTGKLQAAWVAEGGQKPVSQGGMQLVNISPHKLAVIAVVSEETVRADPGGYVTSLQDQMAEAFAIGFDAAAFHGDATPFSTNIDQTTKSVELGSSAAAAGGVFADLNAALRLLVNDGKKLTGFAFDTVAEPDLNGSVDANGRPLFIETPLTDVAPTVRGGQVMGRPGRLADGVAASGSSPRAVGYAGDWSQVVWGVIGGINYAVSTETTVTINGQLTSLWEHNLMAIRAEAEYGFYAHDPAAFVKLTA